MPYDLLKSFHKYAAANAGKIRELAENGQHPHQYVIGCVDSRAVPEIILQADLGELFTFRPMGAIVRPYQTGTALAANLEFAIQGFGIREIVLLGHSGCGAMKALVDKTNLKEVTGFVKVADMALRRAKETCANDNNPALLLRKTTEETLHLSAENLRAYPSVAALGDEIKIRQWMFDMNTPTMLEFDPASNRWNDTAPAP